MGDLRLVGGETELEGRVEVCTSRSRWGTVCNLQWTRAHTNVVCRQLGYSDSDGISTLICDQLAHHAIFQVHMRHIMGRGLIQYSWTLSTVLGQRSDYGTVLTSLIATDVVTVMMQECAANQVATHNISYS